MPMTSETHGGFSARRRSRRRCNRSVALSPWEGLGINWFNSETKLRHRTLSKLYREWNLHVTTAGVCICSKMRSGTGMCCKKRKAATIRGARNLRSETSLHILLATSSSGSSPAMRFVMLSSTQPMDLQVD